MHRSLIAAVSVLALMATPALAQSKSQSQSGSQPQSESQSQSKSQSKSQSQGSPAQMLGKQVRLKDDKKVVGEITDVVVVNGKVENVVVETKDRPDQPVMVSITQFGPPEGDTYVLSMTEAELKAAPPYEGKSSSKGMQSGGKSGSGSESKSGSSGGSR